MHRISADQCILIHSYDTSDNLLRGGKYRSSATIPQNAAAMAKQQVVQIAQRFSTTTVISSVLLTTFLTSFYLEPKCDVTQLWVLHLMFTVHNTCTKFQDISLK